MTDNPFSKKIVRRQVVAGMAGIAGVAMTQRVSSGESGTDPTQVQGSGPSALGARSSFESPERIPFVNLASVTPLQDLHGTITPADLHFERHHGGIPSIDPNRHELLIHGMVDKAIKFSLADLKRLPSIIRTCFIECSGNLFTGATEKVTPQLLCGLTSQSEWTGVALGTLFREVGVRPNASWFLAEGSDAAVMSRSIPLDKAWDDAMIAYAQNGEAIRPEQGYPFRLLLPGWEGNTSVKWLRRLELSDQPFMTRDETSKYTDPLRDGTARQFSVVIDARSVLTYPTFPATLEKGWLEIRGLAWSGRGRIKLVEVSTDAGKSWDRATLQGPVLSKAHTRFSFPWKWNGQETEIMSRATDETGYIQPTMRQLVDARGMGSFPYHLNPIMSWRVSATGEVFYKSETWA